MGERRVMVTVEYEITESRHEFRRQLVPVRSLGKFIKALISKILKERSRRGKLVSVKIEFESPPWKKPESLTIVSLP